MLAAALFQWAGIGSTTSSVVAAIVGTPKKHKKITLTKQLLHGFESPFSQNTKSSEKL